MLIQISATMKRLLLFTTLVVFSYGCKKNTTEEPAPVKCLPVKVIFEGDETYVYDFDDTGLISLITIDPGNGLAETYAYTWQDGRITNIVYTDSADNSTLQLVPEYDGTLITKISAVDLGELRLNYNGEELTSAEFWVIDGNQSLQIMEYNFSYDANGNLSRSEMSFPQAPNDPPTVTEYEYTGLTGENPLYNTWFIDFLDMSLAMNFPTKITKYSVTETFTITLNEEGLPERMEGDKGTLITVVYNCS